MSQNTGISTAASTDGSKIAAQTDGVRVAWQTKLDGTTEGPQGLADVLVIGGPLQQESRTLQNFSLVSGLRSWKEQSTQAGGIQVSDGTGTTVIDDTLTSVLYGVDGGYVIWSDRNKLYSRSAGNGSQVLLDAPHASVLVSDKTVLFTAGSDHAFSIYETTMN